MRFAATDIFAYYKPSACVRRVALRARGVEEQDTDSPFLELLRDLGHRHEAAHVGTLPGLVDLSAAEQGERERLTLASINAGSPAIYQPRFRVELRIAGEMVELVGEPDFLIRDAARGGYRIRDSKLARDVFATRHAGIPLQLQIYGFLYERTVGRRPLELEVHNGADDIVAVAYKGEGAVFDALREHLAMRRGDPAVYEPVGLTKCAGCGYQDRCGGEAEAAQDVALLSRVNQDRARAFQALGIRTIADIPRAVEDPRHRDYFWTGKKKPRMRDFVAPLLRSAESWLTRTPIRLDDAPPLPAATNVAMLDLEGLPPYADELDRIYLWGVKVYGDRPSPYLPAQSGFGPDGDRQGWFAFLRQADQLFADYGPDLPFIHWSSYEKTKLIEYIKRYGDLSLSAALPPLPAGEGRGEGSLTAPGIAAQILANLVDLLTLLKNTYVLPLPSYSLKVVERYVGFHRTDKSINGAGSIAKYIEATETDDPAAREAIVGEILAYNEEDLEATHAVLAWLHDRA